VSAGIDDGHRVAGLESGAATGAAVLGQRAVFAAAPGQIGADVLRQLGVL
jgi:hypothetical protein